MTGRGRILGGACAVACAALGGSPAHAAAPNPCPGPRFDADKVITGEFGSELEGAYVLVPFDVPAGQTAVRLKYCHDNPELPTSQLIKHVLDFDLYGPRKSSGDLYGPAEYRGGSGGRDRDKIVTISNDGYDARTGRTTKSFHPGAVKAGEWAAQFPLPAVVGRDRGDTDGKVAWRLEVDWSASGEYADEPYSPAAYDRTPAKREPGWYAGDFHVHADHSEGSATMREAFDYAFRPLGRGAGLDFITLSDHNTDTAWNEIGRFQGDYPGKLIVRSAEVTTPRGHAMNHASGTYVDHRTGPVYERRSDGSLVTKRAAQPASRAFDDVHRGGGFTQINHPTLFPPPTDFQCLGCVWEYSPSDTDYGGVDAIEVATGPSGLKTDPVIGPSPFTLTAIQFYEDALSRGGRAAAIGGSDSHDAGRISNPVTSAPIGEPTTAVYAQELSEPGIECGVKAGHTYVKVTGGRGPDVRLEARAPGGSGPPAIIGDTIEAADAQFSARVTGGDGRLLLVLRNGVTSGVVPVLGNDFTHRFRASGPGRYRLQLMRGTTIETVSSPIYVEQGAGEVLSRDCTPLRVKGSAKRQRLGRKAPRVRCAASGARLRACTVEARMSTGSGKQRKVRSVGRGQAKLAGGKRTLRLRLSRAARREIAKHGGGRRLKLVFTADDGDGAEARSVTRVRLLPAR